MAQFRLDKPVLKIDLQIGGHGATRLFLSRLGFCQKRR
jgi:hypothetical protein